MQKSIFLVAIDLFSNCIYDHYINYHKSSNEYIPELQACYLVLGLLLTKKSFFPFKNSLRVSNAFGVWEQMRALIAVFLVI